MQVKGAVIVTNPEYNIVLKKVHLCFDMKLVIFGINDDSGLIIQPQVAVQPWSQTPLTLYQIERVPVPIID